MITYKIKEQRQKIGVTQADLRRKTGISRAQMSKLENGGKVDIKLSTLLKISEALNCPLTSLFE